MGEQNLELFRKYGYDILINRFEPLLRNILVNEVFILNFGLKKWREEIPKGIVSAILEEKDIKIDGIDIKVYFEELYLLQLKEIAIYSNHYRYLECLTKELSKEKFIEYIDELNEIRRKIAHAKSTFTRLDLQRIIEIIRNLCQGKIAENLIKYIENESYKSAEEIPFDFFQEYDCPNNLPIEEYDLDGGFVGRKKEIKTIKRLLYCDQDRIITITGAGGVGKTAVTLRLVYNILYDYNNPFEAIVWFSAKEKKLTSERGIVKIDSDIASCEQLVKEILKIVDNKTLIAFEKNNISCEKYIEHLYDIFSSQKCLLIIDNLETIRDEDTLDFIKDIPRPSQVLITSRKGLGEIERRYSLPDFTENDAIILFRIIAKERERIDLLRLPERTIANLTKKVKYYPLLIKWSIGKVCLGNPIEEAFSEIYSGKSEIAEFVFNDIFELLSPKARLCLYSMIVFGDRKISRYMLMHISNLDHENFDDVISELIITSFVYPEVVESDEGLVTNYNMLSLTRGFITSKLDEDKKTLNVLQTRYHDLSKQIEQIEKSQSAYYQSLFSLGIKSEEEKIAFNYVKTAKNFIRQDNYDKAEENFEEAIKIAPKFAYALIEYAKFEFWRKHTANSNVLFKRAIDADPENYHGFFSYGICLKKQNKLTDAIKILEKAQELNPDHLPIHNELGRTYSFNGEYEKADDQFEKAKKQAKHPNYMHKFLTLQYQADNYRRWAETFFQRRDYSQSISKLNLALTTINNALNIKRGDRRAILLEKDMYLQIAINLCESENYDDAIPYFNKCIKKIVLTNGMEISSDHVMARAYYYYAYYAINLNKLSSEKIKDLILKGKAITTEVKYIPKYKYLLELYDKKFGDRKSKRKNGIIDWYNKHKYYGIILSGEDSFLFLLSDFNKRIEPEEFDLIAGQNVNFTLRDNPQKSGEKIATDIKFDIE